MQRPWIATLLVLSGVLGGCTSYNSENVVIREALQEKEAAYIRLAKAITSYCSVSTDTLDARQTCILERRLAVERPDNPQQIPSSSHSQNPR
jgi:hypothetical protein